MVSTRGRAASRRRRCRRRPHRRRRSDAPGLCDVCGPSALLGDLALGAVALALDDHGVDVVQDAVEDGGGKRAVVVEDLRPVLVGTVGGDHHRRAFVAPADDLEQQIGAVLVDRQIAKLVDDQQPGLKVAADLPLEADCAAASVLMMSTAVVNSAECPPTQAAWPRAMAMWVLPRPTVLINTTLVFSATKARRNRFWICGRLIFFGHVHSKSSIVLRTGKRACLMRRAMARVSRVLASPSISSAR